MTSPCRTGFSTVTLLTLQPATSDLLMKIAGPPLRQTSLSVDQCDIFIEPTAPTLLLKPNFISRCHVVLRTLL